MSFNYSNEVEAELAVKTLGLTEELLKDFESFLCDFSKEELNHALHLILGVTTVFKTYPSNSIEEFVETINIAGKVYNRVEDFTSTTDFEIIESATYIVSLFNKNISMSLFGMYTFLLLANALDKYEEHKINEVRSGVTTTPSNG